MNQVTEAIQQDVTQLECKQASNYLLQAQQAFLHETAGLSEAQWHFKPAPDRWSIAEILEHLVIVGKRIEDILVQLQQAPAPPPDFDSAALDDRFLNGSPIPTKKYTAPEFLAPNGRWTPAVALEHLSSSCSSVSATLHTACQLRSHVISHPAFGPLDGYHWVLLAAAHIARHTHQLLGVKSDVNFPAQ